MQASLGNVIKVRATNEDIHFEDTVRGSDWGADQRVVACSSTPRRRAVRELAAGACREPGRARRPAGDHQRPEGHATERDEAHGLVAQRDFGGTKKWRTCIVSTAPATRAVRGLRTRGRRVDPGARADGGDRPHSRMRAAAYGAVVRILVTGELSAYVAKATTIRHRRAGGSTASRQRRHLRRHRYRDRARDRASPTLGTWNAVQFHPTGIFRGRHTSSPRLPRRRRPAQGCRRSRFMPDYEPEKKEHRVARRGVAPHGDAHQERQGREVALRRPPLARHHQLGRAHIEKNLREVKENLRVVSGRRSVEQ
jgi:fumarate reductase flavoprotein subunit